MYNITAALAVVAVTAGCATPAQRQFQAMKTGNALQASQVKACSAQVYRSAEYDPIRSHLPESPSDATLQQLSDRSFATPEEIKAISVTHPRAQACRKAFLQGLTQTEPSLVPILTASYNKNEDDLLGLTQHKMAWGDYVRRIRDRSAETQAAIQAEDRRVVSELRYEDQEERAERQRAAEAFAAWAQTQEMINAANRPVITNCSGFGNMVNCISR